MAPEISIIIPAYNEEKNIARCLNSVLAQTFESFEVICVDDGSTDGTVEIIKSFAEKDDRIILLKNPDKGVSSARNFGIENARGNYIGFVDSDDFIQPQMYEFLHRAVTENNCDFSVCKYKKTDEIKEKNFEYKTENFYPENFIENFDETELVFSSACTKLISKNILKDIRFKNFKIGEDTIFNSELYSKSSSSILVNAELYTYYINTQSVSFTELWSEKWFDLLQTRFFSYDILKEKNKALSSFYLERGMKLLLSYNFNLKGSPNEKKFKLQIKKYLKNYIKPFMICKSISLKNKLTIPIFFLIPPLYTAFRKMMDKTL